MCVPAEDPFCPARCSMCKCSRRHFGRHPHPARVHAVNPACNAVVLRVELLQFQESASPHLAQFQVIENETIELVPVNGNVPDAAEGPQVFLIHPHSDQVRHDVREPMVVVAFDPNDFNPAFWIRQLANVRKKSPVVFLQPTEIQITEDVAQENQPAEALAFQHVERVLRPARLRTEMQV